jgi:hypothetical protein
MLSIIEKQEVISPINKIISKVLLRKTNLEFEYEKWVDDCIAQGIFSLETEVPVNSNFNNKTNFLDAIHRDVVVYKDFVVKFLRSDMVTLTFEGCNAVVERECSVFEERLKLVDKI